MPPARSLCPHLPPPTSAMTHQCLTELRNKCPSDFYRVALTYGHYLWLNNHSGRAILALTRALYADSSPCSPILKKWPLPYAALAWIVNEHSSDHFPGNPLISFQHQATRIRGPRQNLHRARAQAVWALIRLIRPALPVDSAERTPSLSRQHIVDTLQNLGHPGEASLWQQVYTDYLFRNRS